MSFMRSKFTHSDVLCPYCLKEIRDRDLKYICPRCSREVERSNREILFKKAPKCKEKGCHGAVARKKLCGECKHELPTDILEYKKNLRFSIIGITGSGKTNFLTTMIHELKQTRDFPLVISSMDAQTGMVFQENEDTIYNLKQKINPNPPGTFPQPQQWKIRDRSKMTNRTIPSYSLTIFDGAGEDCERTDPIISRYISGSKELIILFDPLTSFIQKNSEKNIDDIEEIRMRSTVTDHMMGASARMVNEIANYIRESCDIRADRLIDKDVAIVFTKFDELREDFGFSRIGMPSPHVEKKAFVKEDSDEVDKAIREWLFKNDEFEFLNEIEANFNPDRVRYFGVSSFGTPPNKDGSLNDIEPHRVLDPLFWMLANEKILPTILNEDVSADS